MYMTLEKVSKAFRSVLPRTLAGGRGFLRWSLLGLLVVVAAAGGWWLMVNKGNGAEEYVVQRGPLTDTVRFTGKLNTRSRATLSFERGGVVSFVAPVGQKVRSGAVIARLQAQDAQARVANAQAALEAEEANLQKLLRGARPEEKERARIRLADAQEALRQKHAALISTARKVQSDMRSAITQNLDIIMDDPARSQRELKFKTTRSAAADRLLSGREVVMGTVEAMGQSIAALETAPSSVEVLRGHYEALKRAVGEVRSLFLLASDALDGAIETREVSRPTLESFRTSVAGGLVALSAAEVALDGAFDAVVAAQQARNLAQADFAVLEAGSDPQDIALAQARIASQRALLEEVQAELGRYRIIAPFAGEIGSVYVGVGDRVQPYEPIVELLSSGSLLVEGRVSELDVPFLSVGQDVEITFDALGEKEKFVGKVTQIDRAEQEVDATPTYEVKIAIDASDPRLAPGMTTNVMSSIIRAQDALLLPRRFVWYSKGESYVYVQTEGGREKEARRVTLGRESRSGVIEVLAGLEEGEVVVSP